MEGAEEFISGQDLKTRCQIIGGNFTSSVPHGGDLYIFKRIFTSESDERLVQALQNCKESMNPGGKILTIEPNINTDYGTLYDILMLAMTGGRLRSQEEYQKLLDSAAPAGREAGIRRTRVRARPTSRSSIRPGQR